MSNSWLKLQLPIKERKKKKKEFTNYTKKEKINSSHVSILNKHNKVGNYSLSEKV